MHKKTELHCCFVLSLCILLIGGSLPCRSVWAADTMKIGILTATLPGGKGIENAARMAADEINGAGGILGKEIELVYGNAKDKPILGAYEYTRLAEKEKVIAVLGPASSEIALKIMEQVPRCKVPFLVIGAGTPKVGEEVAKDPEKYRQVFKVFHNSYEMGQFTTEWIVKELIIPRKMKKAALAVESAVWALPLARAWKTEMEKAGCEVVIHEYFDYHTKDFFPIVRKISQSGADALIVAFARTDPTAFVSLWADQQGPVMAGIIGLFQVLGKNAGEKSFSTISMAYPGVFGLTARDSLFCEKYLLRFKSRPEYTSAYTYDAMHILKKALESTGSTESAPLTQALEQTDHEGIMGRWVFDPVSHNPRFGPGYRRFMMVQWQPPGKLCCIWPEEMKNCDLIFPPWYQDNNQAAGKQNPE